MVKFIETELDDLRREVDQMWTLVCSQMEQARQAVLEMDRAAAQQIHVRERRVDAFELKIDSDVEDFIALYTPVAVDLRFALAMLKINNDLERIGDYADGIARFVRDSDAAGLDPGLVGNLQLETMFDTVLGMLKGLQEALRTEDAAKATAIVEKDDLRHSRGVRACPSGAHRLLHRFRLRVPQARAHRRPPDEHSRGNRVLHRRQGDQARRGRNRGLKSAGI